MTAKQLPELFQGWPGILANLGAVAVLCWIVIVQVPADRAAFTAELAAQRKHDEERTEKILRAIERRP
jgi:hypothetical protein